MDFIQLMAADCEDLMPIIRFIKLGVLPIIQIGIPIILIVMGTIDLGKAVLSSDDKEIKASTTRLLKRAIAAVAVFFAYTIVNAIMGLLKSDSNDINTTDWATCWDNS